MQVIQDYRGRPVRLTDERLRHIPEHPEMAGLEADIVRTLRQPSIVIQSLSDPQAVLHYRFYLAPGSGTNGSAWS